MATAKALFGEEVMISEGIVRVLEDAGIDMVFGIAGGNMGRLYYSLYDHPSTIRTVLVRHEQLASVMAEVYGRLTGKPGVAIGQGAFVLSNALLGTIEAHMGSSPMLLLTDLSDQAPFSQHAPYQGGTGEYGTFDIKGALEAVTKYTVVSHSGVQAVQNTQLAIKHAVSGEQGPVAVIYHGSAFAGSVGPDSVPTVYPIDHYLPRPGSGDSQTIERVATMLKQADCPVIIAGNGVRLSKAYDALIELAETLAIPVATTASGKGVFPEVHALALGTCGNFGQTVANDFIGAADLVLAVGTRLGPTDTVNENPRMIDPARQDIVQIDIESKNAGWTFPCAAAIVGDAGAVLKELLACVKREAAGSATIEGRMSRVAAAKQDGGFFSDAGYASDEVPILPQRLIREIHDAVDDRTIICCDAGENRLFMTHYFQTKAAGSLLMPGIGAMGYAVPAAMAARLVYPDRPVLGVCGDGGFGMALNGLMTARDEKIPVGVVILNNSALGWVKHGQGNRVIASEFTEMNYAEIANAMGCKGIRVEKAADLPAALAEALSGKQPTVVDVVTSFKTSFRDVTSPLTRRN